jgi:hypothetical protein
MIAASRRRRPGVGSQEEAFRLHLRLARHSGTGRRLVRGSLAALVCSVIALFVGLDLVMHGALVAAGFFVGFAVPVRGLRQQALAEIRAHAGMSYETALDLLGDSTTRRDTAPQVTADQAAPDPYGFRSAVIDRARRAVADVRPTAAPAWWLPALAVALALVLVGGLDLASPPGSTGANGLSSPPSGSSVVPLDERDDLAQDSEVLAPQEQAPGRAEEPEAGDEASAEDQQDEGNASEPAEGSGDGAPMSRFLDSLRERPPEAGGGNQPQDQAGEGSPDSQPPGQGEPGAGRQGEPDRVELPADPGSQAGEDGQASGAGDDGAGEGGDDVLVASESSEEGGAESPGESQTGESNGQAPGEGQAAENQPAEGGGEGEQGLEQGGAADGEGSDDPAGEGFAGFGAGPESPAGVADGQAERPEFLQGVLEAGPESPAGAVRLPGQTDVTLPLGVSSLADYAAAAEEALSEGDLPLSYQEIIRRYFR